jgi:hypothetical protein
LAVEELATFPQRFRKVLQWLVSLRFQYESRRLVQLNRDESTPPYSRAAATACACSLLWQLQARLPEHEIRGEYKGQCPLWVT